MPMYEYTCRDCKDQFELLVRRTDTPACPSCGGQNLEQMLSTFAVNSAERSRASIAKAKLRYQQSRGRRDEVRHQTEEVREHIQDDYGIDLGRKAPVKPPA